MVLPQNCGSIVSSNIEPVRLTTAEQTRQLTLAARQTTADLRRRLA
ncbi:MAG: hypothetical protein ACRCUY_11000 [Thermoguttaceae bacterium]